ncbi:MAG TPA: hypothetical protein DCX03_00970, partial [Bacteroidales bacterium]|nr:hypothetical protein [Bacteroidales bacterium]
MSENEIHPLVLEAEELYHDYEAYHDIWAEQAQMNRDYVYNKQWSEDEVEELQKRNQAPLVVNRIFPAIDAKMAIMAAKNPGVRVTGREDSDNKVARIFEDIMQYCWQISDGDSLSAQALADSLITGLGYMYVYVDKYADDGLGEVKFGYADPDDIYIDPTSKDPLCRDAESILIVKHITKRQAKLRYPQYQEIIDAAETSIEKQRGGSMHADEGQIVGRDMVDIKKEKVRIIERYYKTIKNFVRFVDESGEIQVLPEEEFNAINEGVAESPTSEGNIDILGYVYVPRIRVSGIVGSDLLYDVELPIEDYPIVPFCNVYTGTPYGMGEPAFLMGQQDMLNKLYSLMIAHTQTSTNPKVFVEKGSVEDIDQFRIEYSKPGAVMEYMPGVTPPKDIPPVPLSNALFSLAADMKYETEYSSGVFPLMQGSSQGAPETFRGTLAIEEFGNRRIMLKMKTVERALTQLFKQAVTLAQTVYTTHKIFRLIQPNGLEMSQEANIPIYDDA